MSVEWNPAEDDEPGESQVRAALRAGRHDAARTLAEQRAGDPMTPRWLVADMLESIGLSLAHAGRHDPAALSTA